LPLLFFRVAPPPFDLIPGAKEAVTTGVDGPSKSDLIDSFASFGDARFGFVSGAFVGEAVWRFTADWVLPVFSTTFGNPRSRGRSGLASPEKNGLPALSNFSEAKPRKENDIVGRFQLQAGS
jgi:hypothetical protein